MTLAGCSGGGDTDSGQGDADRAETVEADTEPDADNDGVPDSDDDYPNDPERSAGKTSRGNLDVAEDEWSSWTFEFSEPTHIEYEMVVRDGPSVDVILFGDREYEYFENQDRAKYYSGLSDLDTTRGLASGWVEAGDYVLVVDNTEWGEAAPPTNLDDDVAEVEYTLTLSR
jgi:hypothetical protein